MSEPRGIDPNEFVHDLDLFARWAMQLLENNGSTEIDEEGAPMFNNYTPATLAAFASAMAYAKLLRMIAACIFMLNQGDFSEQEFHREIDNALNMLEDEADRT
jgi:hypothetical protein